MKEKKEDLFDRIMRLPGMRLLQPIYLKYKEVWIYLFFGGLTFLVSIGTYAVFNVRYEINELLANFMSWVAAVLFAYITNKIWVFQSNVSAAKELVREIMSFFGGRIFTLFVEGTILLVFITMLEFDSVCVKVVAQVIVIILNYFISKRIVFRKTGRNTDERKAGSRG